MKNHQTVAEVALVGVVVVVPGKSHETFQILKSKTNPFRRSGRSSKNRRGTDEFLDSIKPAEACCTRIGICGRGGLIGSGP